MKILHVIVAVVAVVSCADVAHATNWRRARGVLAMTYYEDNFGNFLDSVPEANRRMVIDADLRRSSNTRGVQTSCKDVRRLKQRTCVSRYYRS